MLVLALALPAGLRAQDSLPAVPDSTLPPPARDSAGRPIGVWPPDTVRRIQKIRIIRSDVFDSTETGSWFARVANGLHIMTRPGIVEQELLFQEGEPFDSARAAETERNLRSRGVFRKVEIDTVTGDSGVIVQVVTKDGWSTQADVRFRSAGDQLDWQVALIERNLIGTATRFAIRYRDTPDRSSLLFQFLQPRLFARSWSLGLRYEDRSDGLRSQVAVERPFFTLSDRFGLQSLFDYRNERVLQFFNGVGEPGDSLRRRFVVGRVEAARALRAGSGGYLRVGFFGQVRRDDYAAWPSRVLTESITGTFGPTVEYRRANFAVTSGFARVGQEEDVDLSTFIRMGLFVAPEFLGYDRDGLGGLLQVRVGTRLSRGGFAWLDGRVNGVLTSEGVYSGSVTLGATAVVKPARRHLLIGHADIGWLRAPLPGTEFDLGFALGPRGFPIHAFTGDRTYYTTAEYRVIFTEDFLKTVALGVATFVDHGGAWYAGQSRRTGTNVGLGFRFSPSRVADANQTRLDLAYRFKNDQERAGWVFVVASGLTFSLNPRGP